MRNQETMTLQDLEDIQKKMGFRSVGDAVDAFKKACEFHYTIPMLSDEVADLLRKERYFEPAEREE